MLFNHVTERFSSYKLNYGYFFGPYLFAMGMV